MAECRYCELVKDKKNLLYEDEKLIAVLPERPMTKGHVEIIAKEHHDTIQDMEDKDVEHLFYAASFSASALFENLQAHGTNIIARSGNIMKKGGHFHIDVVSRTAEDGLNFLWKPQQMAEEELKQVQGKIKDKCDTIGFEKKNKEPVDLDKKPEKLESSEKKAPEAPSEEPEKKDFPSEEEQRYKKEQEAPAEEKGAGKEETKESYLVKQLRRVP